MAKLVAIIAPEGKITRAPLRTLCVARCAKTRTSFSTSCRALTFLPARWFHQEGEPLMRNPITSIFELKDKGKATASPLSRFYKRQSL
jgi:hypothetical protein